MLELPSSLPTHLRERSRVVGAGRTGSASGRSVVYWTHHALRIAENPALEVAATMAAAHGLPLVVAAAVSAAHPIPTNRHARFFLEGVRDLALELRARGVETVVSLDARADAVEFIAELAGDSALLVTDDFPARPHALWIESVAARLRCPVIAVDGACVVPLGATDKPYDRAFAFRDATARERERQLAAPWPSFEWPALESPTSRTSVPTNTDQVIDWAACEIGDLVASLEVDHSVGPVTDTEGGSRAADARWRSFLAGPIDDYARDRNDAAIPATSRMSAYLHYGMISPLRVARDARARGGEGAEKYLDELLVWRELAYHWCRHVPKHASMGGIPAWARETLATHASDARDVLPRERLARGMTGVRLWDLAQRSLVVHGELHNNLRMTWGKAIPLWTATPEAALETLIELNDRYALDGGDPSSYAGLLWCLGLFDRPFAPEVQVLGRVRPRPIAGHEVRLDLDAYERMVERPAHRMRVAVIGAGISGTACARVLAEHGLDVSIVEKSRGPGGRMSTRRSDAGAFDHGAQYFTARDARFESRVRDWIEQGIVARWDGRFAELNARGLCPVETPPRYVATPAMSSICAHLAAGIPMETGARVVAIAREGRGWRLDAEASDGAVRSLGPFNEVLVTTPAPQAAELLGAHAPDLAALARETVMEPMWALMVAFDTPLGIPADHVRVADSAATLAWLSRVSSKPGRARDGRDRWVVLASAGWSRANLELDADAAASALLAAFQAFCASQGYAGIAPTHTVAHRWRFALPAREGTATSLFDGSRGLGVAGDWLRGTRVEDAFLSGVALAGRVLGASARVMRTR
jgi:photolyase PhrII